MRFSLADVATVAEVSKSGLLYHFSNREALLVAVVDHASPASATR
ncbi:TetR family transcriptional regulator [Nonomuraea rubra]